MGPQSLMREGGWLPEYAPLMGKVSGLDYQSLGRWGWLPRSGWGRPPSLQACSPWPCWTSVLRPSLSATLLLPSATCLPKAVPVLGTSRNGGFPEGDPLKWLLVPWAALPPYSSFSPSSGASPAISCKSLPQPTPSLLRASSCRHEGLGDKRGHSGPEGGDLQRV